MSTLVMSDKGSAGFLNARLNNSFPVAGNDLILKLFCNDFTPTDESVAGDFTEAQGGGYVAKTLTCGNWTVDDTQDPPIATYTQQVFTFTGTLTTNGVVYGYYIVNEDGIHQWAERFDSSYTPQNNGDHLDVTPRCQGSKGTPT